jgi:hypothetical protein
MPSNVKRSEDHPGEQEPAEDHSHVRPAGSKRTDIPPGTWSETAEEVDESFPASDPPGNY